MILSYHLAHLTYNRGILCVDLTKSCGSFKAEERGSMKVKKDLNHERLKILLLALKMERVKWKEYGQPPREKNGLS